MPTWIRQPSRKIVQGRTEYDPGAIKCSCGRKVELTQNWQGTACSCGNEYGSGGELFRANWREFCLETGEITEDDLLRP
ncbi:MULTISPECIES: hypothetical protein [Deinococcus]|uniref:Uncharacterized protein n=2 Tax=Deinococcus TaxID=1298 RepID=H8H319_DEIGI|nr:hypothetical protein [Deinococcus gobiensis]AFD27916.1 hypothetical protein DGo_PC0124 [Deinococcus gobiensis I-0]